MRAVLSAAVCACVLSSTTGRADDAATAMAVVAKAIKATGWKDEGKPVLVTWKEKGIFSAAGFKLDYTSDWYFRAPDAMRFEMAAEFMGKKMVLKHVVNGTKAWDAADGRVEEETGDKKALAHERVYQLWVLTLTPLTADTGFKLAPAGEKKVNDRPAVGVKVERAGKPTVTLYFDKETGLPAKAEMKVKDEFQGWKEVPEEHYLEDWKDAGGRKQFGKVRVVRDGKPMIESTLSDVKRSEKIDAKLFEKP